MLKVFFKVIPIEQALETGQEPKKGLDERIGTRKTALERGHMPFLFLAEVLKLSFLLGTI